MSGEIRNSDDEVGTREECEEPKRSVHDVYADVWMRGYCDTCGKVQTSCALCADIPW